LNVYDLQGRLVLAGQVSRDYAPGVYNVTIDLGPLEKGAYVVRLEGREGEFVSKIVVKQY